jgi:hypothetical protein
MSIGNTIEEKFLKSRTAAGLDLWIEADGTARWNLVVLKKDKSSVKPEISKSGITDLEELKSLIPKNTPVLLNIQGKGIMHRKLPVSENDTETLLLQKVLPNAALQDFYVQKSPILKNHCFISVIRKSVADEWLEVLRAAGVEVITCALGPFCLESILPLMSMTSDYAELLLPGWKLLINANTIETCTPSDNAELKALMVGGMSIEADVIFAFASGFAYYLGGAPVFFADIQRVTLTQDNFKQKKLFQVGGWTTLIFGLTILLVNYVLFDHYWKKSQELQQQASLNSAALESFDKLKAELSSRQAFAEKTGMIQSSRTSLFADRIAMDLPEAIELSEMNIYPRVKRLSGEENLAFTQKEISVKGVCKIGADLNSWIKDLKKKDFVKDVELINYSQDNSREPGSFIIAIKLN